METNRRKGAGCGRAVFVSPDALGETTARLMEVVTHSLGQRPTACSVTARHRVYTPAVTVAPRGSHGSLQGSIHSISVNIWQLGVTVAVNIWQLGVTVAGRRR